jgi:hypothetical protein
MAERKGKKKAAPVKAAASGPGVLDVKSLPAYSTVEAQDTDETVTMLTSSVGSAPPELLERRHDRMAGKLKAQLDSGEAAVQDPDASIREIDVPDGYELYLASQERIELGFSAGPGVEDRRQGLKTVLMVRPL